MLLMSPSHLDLQQIFHKLEWSVLIWAFGSRDGDERPDVKSGPPFGSGDFKITEFLLQPCLTCT